MACLLGITAFTASAHECQPNDRSAPVNLTVPLTVQMPTKSGTAPVGSVLFVKEASLAQWTGTHREISPTCLSALKRWLNGRMNTMPAGKNIFSTAIPGVGLRITVIYDKPGAARQEWVLPFNTLLNENTQTVVNTDEINIRLEVVKTGAISGGNINVNLPSLISFSDRSLIINLSLNVLAARAQCSILLAQPQIELPPISMKDIENNVHNNAYPVEMNLQCLNTRQASIDIEGATNETTPSVFNNIVSEHSATGVGIEMLYNGSVMTPHRPVEIIMPQQHLSIPIPLAVRYAKSGPVITSGKVKAQITLRINYL
jgi:type 1 fimbria pilin